MALNCVDNIFVKLACKVAKWGCKRDYLIGLMVWWYMEGAWYKGYVGVRLHFKKDTLLWESA